MSSMTQSLARKPSQVIQSDNVTKRHQAYIEKPLRAFVCYAMHGALCNIPVDDTLCIMRIVRIVYPADNALRIVHIVCIVRIVCSVCIVNPEDTASCIVQIVCIVYPEGDALCILCIKHLMHNAVCRCALLHDRRQG